MKGAVLVAIIASIGNLLQGWDNSTMAVAVFHIKREFNLESEPAIEGLIFTTALAGATIVTMSSGAVSDSVGRHPMLIAASVLYFVSGLLMSWSPNVYTLLLARLIAGFGFGLAVTLVPVYISETSPPDIRGFLNTLPQFTGSIGMFISYCMVYLMSLKGNSNWRVILGVLSAPSLVYFLLIAFYLPESPRWLVSKGRMAEAKKVLQMLRESEDVSGEMALLVEGLGVGGETSIEEYIIGPANEITDDQEEKITLYRPQEGLSWVARPVRGQSALGSGLGLVSRHGSNRSMESHSIPGMDPLVNLFGSVHEKLPEMGSMPSTLFPNFGSMFSAAEPHPKTEQWDEENGRREGEEYVTDDGVDSDDNIQSPLLSRRATSMEGKEIVPHAHGSVMSMRRNSSLMQGNAGDTMSNMGIGGGWQLAWKWTEREGSDGRKEGGFKRIYLHQEGVSGSRRGSLVSLPGGHVPEESEYIQAAALVSQPALYSAQLRDQHPAGPAMTRPSETSVRGPRWRDIFEPGVKRALIVGVGLQILQQFAGINGVLYYTPQILKQAGVGVLLANMGITAESASILISGLTTLLMIPSIGIAMKLMDVSGRRSLLLSTIPFLIAALIILVVSNLVDLGTVAHAVLSTVSVIVYLCCFVMGFGPIPNILCAEIFPTRVRGICIAICALSFWFCNIIVTYSLPVMLNSIGLAGVFGIYAIVCLIALVFVFLRVPETKGMPLEVITEFFCCECEEK